MPALQELDNAYRAALRDGLFVSELRTYLRDYVGRPTPLYYAAGLSARVGGRVYLKREDLNHTGAHKMNNAIAQALLARRMGKKRLVAETGAGQHGVATATAAAALGLQCTVYMGENDMARQKLNVYRMRLLGAEVLPVSTGTGTLKEATSEAIRDWVTNVRTTHYTIGSVVGPHPYPTIVRDFQSVIGREAKSQVIRFEGRLPDYLIACVGGGSNAMGLFYPFLRYDSVRMIGVEAAGYGMETGKHAATLSRGTPGVLHGAKSYLLQDEDGQVKPVHSVSAGLDYPGVGPEHSFLKDSGRVAYVAVTDWEAVDAFHLLSRLEGIVPALEPAHAIAYLDKMAGHLRGNDVIIVCLSGRGDKDVDVVYEISRESQSYEPALREPVPVSSEVG